MHDHIQIAGISVPSYALMVFLGVAVICIITTVVARGRSISLENIVPIGIVGGFFSIIGAKLYSIILIEADSSWGISFTKDLFSSSGYVFYGGMLTGLLSMKVFSMLQKIDLEDCLSDFIFEIPLLHSFWKVGCLLGGCCYGIEYDGYGSIVFPEGVVAPVGVPLFPVQILEMAITLVISMFLFVFGKKKRTISIELYLITYGMARFGIEFLRLYSNKYRFMCNLIISVACVFLSVISIYRKNSYQHRREIL